MTGHIAAYVALISLQGAFFQENLDPRVVYQKVAKNTIWIHVNDGTGSGFIINPEKRLAITNQHVVGFQSMVGVVFPKLKKDGKVETIREAYTGDNKIAAEVLDIDYDRDLALIRILGHVPDYASGLPLASSYPDPGESVLSVGNPGKSAGNYVLSMGNVRDRVVRRLPSGIEDRQRKPIIAIETQIPTNPGDSGGPAANMKGEVVGVTQGGVIPGAGHLVAFIVPSGEVSQFLAQAEKWSNPKTPDELFNRARHRMEIRLFESAMSDLTYVLKHDSTKLEAYLFRGLAALETKKYSVAIDDLTNFINNNKNLEVAYAGRAAAYLGKGDLEKAIGDVHEAVRLAPNKAEHIALRSKIFLALGRHEEHRKDLDKAMEMEKSNPIHYRSKGRHHLEAGQYSEGEAVFTSMINQFKDAPDAYLWRARCRLRLGLNQEALEDIESFLRYVPSNPLAIGCKADALHRLGQSDAALELAEKALASNALAEDALLAKSTILLSKKRYDEALDPLDQLVKMKAFPGEVLIARAYAQCGKGQLDLAMEDYQALEKIHGYGAIAANFQGTIHHRKKNYAEAIKDFDEAIEKDPRMFFAYYNRALSLVESGEKNRAKEDLKKCLELSPEFSAAKMALEKIGEKSDK